MLKAATPDALVTQSHPIRQIKPMVDRAWAQLVMVQGRDRWESRPITVTLSVSWSET